MSYKVTVVIPTLNGAQRIQHVLEALAGQECAPGFFEVIIVDNGSAGEAAVTEDHGGVARLREQNITCRVVREERRGAAHARIRGVLEARSELVSFLDADNVPAGRDYLSTGVEALADPAAGLLVSRVFPEYEVEPPYSVRRREHLLAINSKLGDAAIEWGGEVAMAPTPGAGMWVRRAPFMSLVPWQNPEAHMAGRKGKRLACGEDIEVGHLFGRAGFKRVYHPGLRLRHKIPAVRVKSAYFCRLIVGVVRSQLTLDVRHGGETYGARRRATALAQLAAAALASPLLVFRKDGVREAVFVIANRAALALGPYGGTRIDGCPAPDALAGVNNG